MYYPNDIEDICYEQEHINKVLTEIRIHLSEYFKKYIETEGGHSANDDDIAKLASVFGGSKPKTKPKDAKKILERILKEAIDGFESDRDTYKELLHLESLAEYKHDVSSFKNTILKNQIPIIRKTLQNRMAKELDKYRTAFAMAQPGDLFNVTENIIKLAEQWKHEWYNAKEFEGLAKCDDLGYHELDDENYLAFGVIGGGIKSHFIYKLYPEMYPNRSRESVWALWYLTDKKYFGCKQDSEFLMINKEKGNTQQNYFYPYGLFAFHALQIFNMLKQLYAANGITVPVEYRFVVVDSFLSFVARQHQNEIDILKQNSTDEIYEY